MTETAAILPTPSGVGASQLLMKNKMRKLYFY